MLKDNYRKYFIRTEFSRKDVYQKHNILTESFQIYYKANSNSIFDKSDKYFWDSYIKYFIFHLGTLRQKYFKYLTARSTELYNNI